MLLTEMVIKEVEGDDEDLMAALEGEGDLPPAEEGNEPPAAEEEPTGDEPVEEPNLSPEDEVMKVATDLLETTQGIPTILKAVKATIQNEYNTLDVAFGVVDKLKSHETMALRNVGSRLEQFLNVEP